MKKTLYIKAALSLMSIALLSSCLKSSPYYVDFTKDTPLVELPGSANVSGTAGPFEVVGVLASATAASPFDVAVNLAAPKPLGSPTTVTLKANADSLNSYNNANGTTYTLLPASAYNSTGLSVTIPAGQNLVNLVIEVKTYLLDPTQSYVLPLTIVNGGGIKISNYNTVLYGIVVKNAYDDTYTETGYKFHPTVGVSHPLTGDIPVTTVTATTSNTAVGDLGGSGYSFNFDVTGTNAVTNWVAEGATPPAPQSGFFTADNPGGFVYTTSDGSQPGTAPYVQTTYNNTYDPTSKTFFMHYGYGVGSSGQTGWSRNFYVKLVAD
jgi:hypothetical protein